MEFGTNLSQNLSQKLTLSREMLQSLELIQLPLIELQGRVEKELLENPALEIDERKIKPNENQNLEKIDKNFNDDFFFNDNISPYENYTKKSTINSSDNDSQRQFLEGVISHKENLSDHLIWQLHMTKLDDKKQEIGETIISLINEDGFFLEKIEDVFPENIEIAYDVLDTIQMFDPPGVATSGIRDALLFQLESLSKQELDNIAYLIIKDYFDLMVERKDTLIAKNLKINNTEVKQAFEFLGKFNPYPGREYSNTEVKYIIPDSTVYKRNNELVVEINNDIIPFLTVSKYMNRIASDSKYKKKLDEQKKYVVEKVNQAKNFIKIIRHRNKSLFRLVLSIVKNQENFFNNGPKYIKPLTMKQVADEINLSESTISRLASSKYIQTEWGIHEIKYFFSNAIGKNTENEKSSESVRELIKEIIDSEKDNKISDQKIADILENKGIKIARRTVSKYRNNLNIHSSFKRGI